MRVSDFDYKLPAGRIAQYPVRERDKSRLMVLHREGHKIEHRLFYQISEYLMPGDLMVFNDARVIPARLYGLKKDGRGKVEALLLHEQEAGVWEALVRPAKGMRPGRRLSFGKGVFEAEVCEEYGGGRFLLSFQTNGDLGELLGKFGRMPLPPYIKRDSSADEMEKLDRERYQTVYAMKEGAVAAPTAGLHFTLGLLKEIEALGVKFLYLTLFVGPGTFRPVRVDEVERHRMEHENYYIPETTAKAINIAKGEGRRVIAVGTTTTRALEDSALNGGEVKAGPGEAELFIYPGFRFRVVDALITNFHLPRSSLLMLVSAFANLRFIKEAYQEAISEGYRFYSYGDAMLIL